jgi:hypothetical protein
MTYTMEDFIRDSMKEHFAQLTPKEKAEAIMRLPSEQRRECIQTLLLAEIRDVLLSLQALPLVARREVLRSLPAEELLAAVSSEQIPESRDQLTAARPTQQRKSRRKK